MLKQLFISNFAIIEELDLPLKPGMTVFTGETGAGKSILIDALGLVLGDRADSAVIRAGCEYTEITAGFELTDNSALTPLLTEQAIDFSDNEILIRRVISRDGRSRAFVNNTPVAVNLLRNIGEYLIDIHGQHAHQSLMKADCQRRLLDDYGDYTRELATVHNFYVEWRELTRAIDRLSGDAEDHSAQLALLRYQLDELETLAPTADEYETLTAEFHRLDHASQLIELTQKAAQLVTEDEYSLANQLAATIRDLQTAQKFDKSLTGTIDLLQDAAIQLAEAGDELRVYLTKIDCDPQRLQTVEKRLSDLHDMARKHHIQTQQLCEYSQALQKQLQEMENSQQSLGELQDRQAKALENYRLAAASLHQCRNKTAHRIGVEVTKKLESLGMPGGKFLISVSARKAQPPSPHGSDQIDFMVSANPGQPTQPLRKVASGGELSRISLAIQVICKHERIIPTFVFDEVDAGIGGGIAEIVGKLLHSLTDRHQVFCVTHLPQVASLADQHLQVQKSSQRNITRTRICELRGDNRIEEIARMLAGLKITEQSRKHAREMLTDHAPN